MSAGDSRAESDRHMERVIWKGYSLKEFLGVFRGWDGGREPLETQGAF